MIFLPRPAGGEIDPGDRFGDDMIVDAGVDSLDGAIGMTGTVTAVGTRRDVTPMFTITRRDLPGRRCHVDSIGHRGENRRGASRRAQWFRRMYARTERLALTTTKEKW
jgi:hypothetical protein